MIPRKHPVEDAEHDVRQRQIVVARRWQSLECQPPVIGDVSGGSALKGRQPGDRLGMKWCEPFPHAVEGGVRSLALDDIDRIGGQE